MDCPICKIPIDAESQVVSTPCGHVFHSDCIETWIDKGMQNCPQCRKKISRKTIRPIFLPFSDEENPRKRRKISEGKVKVKVIIYQTCNYNVRLRLDSKIY